MTAEMCVEPVGLIRGGPPIQDHIILGIICMPCTFPTHIYTIQSHNEEILYNPIIHCTAQS